MDEVIQIVGAGVAAVASLVGIVVALEKLTIRTRLKRTAEAAHQLAQQETDPERKRALASVQDLATGRLVSEWIMPGWHVVLSASLAFTGPVVVGSAFYKEGASGATVKLAFVFCALLAVNTQKPIHLTLSRQTIVRDYMAGRRVVRHPTTTGPRWGEYVWSMIFSAASVSLGAGIGLALSGPLTADPDNERVV